MMTQKLYERQGFDRPSCEILDSQSGLEFDALRLELKHSQDYQKKESEYIDYEIVRPVSV